MNESQRILYKLLRIALGNEPDYSLPSVVNWKEVIDMSFDQGVATIAVDGLQRICDSDRSLNNEALDVLDSSEMEDIKYEWFGSSLSNELDYSIHSKKATELVDLYSKGGFKSFVLKGVGFASYYPISEHRTCGDIDLLVQGSRDSIITFTRRQCRISNPMVHHFDASFYPDISVEIHYFPAWVYNPFNNKKLQRFFKDELSALKDSFNSADIPIPSLTFNLVFCIVHIYRHSYDETSSLKQLMDCYLLLNHSSIDERRNAFSILSSIGLVSFVAYLMHRLVNVFHIEESLLLCSPNERCRRPVSEMIWVYPWKIWHYCWRWANGYLKESNTE